MGEHVEFMGKDIYFWNFLVLMFFTLFEVGAVFYDTVPGTEIAITKMTVWIILIVVGIVRRPTYLHSDCIVPSTLCHLDALGHRIIEPCRRH
jgi:hypothetical protein